MKLLRDFVRLRAAGRSLLGHRDATGRSWTITVPRPLDKPAQQPAAIDRHRNADPAHSRPVAQEHEHAAPKTRGHLQLAASH